tara:strand:- start:8102 stop:8506 length:405 start_codon:yes stop_codon:yes gene_type:complete
MLFNKISEDFKQAYLNREMEKKNFLSVLKGEIKLLEGRGEELNDNTVLKVIKKFEKSIKENINRGSESAEIELKWLEPYLPKMMSSDKIEEIVKDLIEKGSDNIGKIMGAFNKEYKGKADNREVSSIAKKLLGD